jgi:hypothetical protein
VKLLGLFLLAAVCATAQSGQKRSDDHFHGVQQRGEAHAGMGFSQTETTHHFILTKSGGYIQVTANDPKDRGSIDQIQTHFDHIAELFAQGDFAIPHFVHAKNPPGVKVMKGLKNEISYSAANLDDGAKLTITSHSPHAIAAIHEFLRFQIKDHRTGDLLKLAATAK